MAANYPISTSADEFERLAIQADLFRDDARAMLARIGGGAGKRVLDLCCGAGAAVGVLSEWARPDGAVVAADLDPVKLAHAEAHAAEAGLANVTFLEADAFATGLPRASFDLVHTRFAISTIQNGLGILDEAAALVRPGGVLFLEEADTRTMACAPPTPDWDEALDLMKRTFLAVGADTGLGGRLDGVLGRMGFLEVQARPCAHRLTSADPMTMHLPLTLAAMASTIGRLGLMTADDLDALVERVADHLATPGVQTTSFAMVQVVGKKLS